MHAGALLVDMGLLSMGTSFLLELAEKWLGYGQKSMSKSMSKRTKLWILIAIRLAKYQCFSNETTFL